MRRFHHTRKILAGALCTCAVLAGMASQASAQEIRYYDPVDVTEELLITRTPETLIVEKMLGIVLDASGNGTIINANDPEYNYISYSGLGFNPLDIILTLDTYNPDTIFTDDVIIRRDFRIGSLLDIGQFPAGKMIG